MALTTGLIPIAASSTNSAAAALGAPATSSSSSSFQSSSVAGLERPKSLLQFEALDDDLDSYGDDQSGRSFPMASEHTGPTGASASDGGSLDRLCVFKLAHKNPASMKRPLSSVDSMRHDDIAVRMYDLVRSEESDICYVQKKSNSEVLLLRFLGNEEGLSAQSLTGALKVWKHSKSQVVNAASDKFSEEALEILSDAQLGRSSGSWSVRPSPSGNKYKSFDSDFRTTGCFYI